MENLDQETAFDSAKSSSNRTRTEVNGAKVFFHTAMAESTGPRLG